MIIAIEHLEKEYGLWILYEYINASKLCNGHIIYTNIRSERISRILSRYGQVYKERINEIYREEDLIILDPEANEALTQGDIHSNTVIVIGGILGDHPPKKRTKKLLTSRMPRAKSRNLGRKQMSIDGAAYTAYQIARGVNYDQIHYIDGLEVEGMDWEITLPYRYPLKDGRPILSHTIRKILEEIGLFDEYWLKTL